MSARSDHQSLRKRMLLARASIERIELAEQVAAVRSAVQAPRLLGASLGSGVLKVLGRSGLSGLFGLLRRYPVLGTGASVLLGRLRNRVLGYRDPPGEPAGRSVLRSATRGALKWGALGLLGWQAWRVWKRHEPPRGEEFR